MSPSSSSIEMFYQFYDRSVPVIEFENWIYENANLKDHMGADDYLELISIDFRHPRAWQDIHKVLNGMWTSGTMLNGGLAGFCETL